MSKEDDWYRNTRWDTAEQTRFYNRLNRSRGDFYKHQYARIKALGLIETGKRPLIKAGVALLEEAIEKWPDDYEKLSSLDHMAHAFDMLNQVESSIDCYQKSFEQQKHAPNLHTNNELAFGEMVARRKLKTYYWQVLRLLPAQSSDDDHTYLFPYELFLLHGVRAVILSNLGDQNASIEARLALRAAGLEASPFRFHSKLGLAPKKHWLKKHLKKLLD
jgi:tetratricopeptide (TPR) repeat protein